MPVRDSQIADRLRERLAADPPALLGGDDAVPDGGPSVSAAVLIAVTDRPAPGTILTVRRDTMRTHAGQIAFPGGRIDPGEDAPAAALREAWEEIALDPARVEILGQLPVYRTITGFAVTPVVGRVPADLSLNCHEAEVAGWFEAPLGDLLDPLRHRPEARWIGGRERRYTVIDWEGRRIWGATAAILVNLSRVLR